MNTEQLLTITTAALLSDGQATEGDVDRAIDLAVRIHNRIVDRKPRTKPA